MLRKLTCGQLWCALEAVEDAKVVGRDSASWRALQAVCEALTSHADAVRGETEAVQVAAGPLPDLAAIDEAIAEVSEADPELSATTLRVLRRARDRVAETAKTRVAERASAGAEFVTRREFDDMLSVIALVIDNQERARSRPGYPDGGLNFRLQRIAEAPKEFALSRDEHKALQLLMSLLDGAANAATAEQRKRAAEGKTYSHRGYV